MKTESLASTSGSAPGGKSLHEVIAQRRATRRFGAESISDAEIDAILRDAVQAPSGYNLQPWRFVVVRMPENLERLRLAAHGQEKVKEASAVLVAFARRDAWSEHADDIIRGAMDRGARPRADVTEVKNAALGFIDSLPREVWLNRHVMIAFTYAMLAAESLGWDTAPMEGFDPAAVRAALKLPDDAVVVALLAIGRLQGMDAPHSGRLPLERLAFREDFDHPWMAATRSELSIDHGEESPVVSVEHPVRSPTGVEPP